MTPPELIDELANIRQRLVILKDDLAAVAPERTPANALLRAALSVAADFLARADRILTAPDPAEEVARDAALAQDVIFSAGTSWTPRESGLTVFERLRKCRQAAAEAQAGPHRD